MTKGLESLARAASEASTGLMKASIIPRPFITQSPPSDGYEPMHIPAWWHEEYLKSLEPKPSRDLFYYIDIPPRLLKRFADDLIVFFGCLGDRLYDFLTGKPSEPHKSFWSEQDERNSVIERMLND